MKTYTSIDGKDISLNESDICYAIHLNSEADRLFMSNRQILDVLAQSKPTGPLVFYLKDASNNNPVDIEYIDKIVLNGSTYEGSDLQSHYNADNKHYTFDYPGEMITYSVITKTSDYQNVINKIQSYDSLNDNSISLIPGTVTLGDITATLNWDEGVDPDNIFDLYTVGYLGDAPEPNDDPIGFNKLLELSYSSHGESFVIEDKTTGQKDFDIQYTTFEGDWSRGEYTTISLPTGKSIEELLRKYSFVFIVNDYNNSRPGESSDISKFGQNAPNMSFTLTFGQYTYNVNLMLPAGQPTESGDHKGNWIAFRTRLLGKDEQMTKIEDVITVYTDGDYSLLDGRKDNTTQSYDIYSGGRGVLGSKKLMKLLSKSNSRTRR